MKKRLDSNIPRKSLRTKAKDFKSSIKTIERILTIVSNKKCYRKINVQKLKENEKPIRKKCCQWLRKNINHEKLQRMMFTDEKIFTKNGYFNPKNDVVWADDRSDANERGALNVMEKYLVSIMVGLGVTWYGVTNPYFFQTGERLNGQTYHDQLLTFDQEEGDELFGPKNWGFQQDGASSHTDQKVQKWCKKNFEFFIPKERWPPNSPELNPLDYSIWDKISNNVQYEKVTTINDLHREVGKSIKKIEIKYVRDVISVFLRRVRSVIKHESVCRECRRNRRG